MHIFFPGKPFEDVIYKISIIFVEGPLFTFIIMEYRQFSNIKRTLECNKSVDHSDVVGASPVGAAPTTSSLPT